MSEENTRKKNENERIVNPEVAEDDYLLPNFLGIELNLYHKFVPP